VRRALHQPRPLPAGRAGGRDRGHVRGQDRRTGAGGLALPRATAPLHRAPPALLPAAPRRTCGDGGHPGVAAGPAGAARALPVGDGPLPPGGAGAAAGRRHGARGCVLAARGRRDRALGAGPARPSGRTAAAGRREVVGGPRLSATAAPAPTGTGTPVLEGRHLSKHYRVKRGHGLLAPSVRLNAVDDVSIGLAEGTVTGLVGESGSGKTTVVRMLAKIIAPDAGEVPLDGRPAPPGRPRAYARQVQTVFQDPFGSLNPVHRVRHHLVRPLRIHHVVHGDAEPAIAELL